jgi:hypothetical protein
VIRQQRSEKKLGFSVPVSLRLSGVDESIWPAIARDLLEGNNVVGEPDLTFGEAALSAEIEPVRPDA